MVFVRKWLKNIKAIRFFDNNSIAVLLISTLLLSTALPNILLIPFILSIVFHKKDISFIKSPFFIFFAAAVTVIILSAISQGTIISDFNKLSKHFLVLVLFILFYQVSKIKQAENAFLLGSSITLLITCLIILFEYFDNPDFSLANGELVNELLILERPYLGFAFALATFIALKKAAIKPKYYVLAICFTAFNIYVSARLAIILCIFLFFIFAIKNSPFSSKKSLGIGAILVIILGFSLSLSDNFMKRIHLDKDYDKLMIRVKAYEPRFIIWPCTYNIIEENILWGTPSFDITENKLKNCYANEIEQDDKRNYYINEGFNTHNQFLDYLMLGGIFSVIFLILSFLIPLLLKNISFEMKIILIMFLAFFIVENVIHRQLGRYFFAIFAALYSKPRNE